MADFNNPPPLPGSASPRTSTMALVSLILGILGLFTCGITALFGLPLGIISLVKVKGSQGKLSGDGIALAGTIVSAVFLLMVPVFAGMLLPVLATAKQRAQTINCVSNEKQLALAVMMYANANSNHFPPAATWCDAIKANVLSPNAYRCPADNSASQCGYAFNAALDGMDMSKVDPRTVMLFESDGGWNASGGVNLMITSPRHARQFVVAHADGSVEILRQFQLSALRWSP